MPVDPGNPFLSMFGAAAAGGEQGYQQSIAQMSAMRLAQMQMQAKIGVAQAIAGARMYGADRGFQGHVIPQTGIDPLTGQPVMGPNGLAIPGWMQTRANAVGNTASNNHARYMQTLFQHLGDGSITQHEFEAALQYAPSASGGPAAPPAGGGPAPPAGSGPAAPSVGPPMVPMASPDATFGLPNPYNQGGPAPPPPGNQNPTAPAISTRLPVTMTNGDPTVTAPSMMNGPVATSPTGGSTPTPSGMGLGAPSVIDTGSSNITGTPGPLDNLGPTARAKYNKATAEARFENGAKTDNTNARTGQALTAAGTLVMKTAGLLPPQEQAPYLTMENSAIPGLNLPVPGGTVALPPGIQGPLAMQNPYYRPLATDQATIAQKAASTAAARANATSLPGYRKGLVANGATTAGASASRAQTYAATAPITAGAAATRAAGAGNSSRTGGSSPTAMNSQRMRAWQRMTQLTTPKDSLTPAQVTFDPQGNPIGVGAHEYNGLRSFLKNQDAGGAVSPVAPGYSPGYSVVPGVGRVPVPSVPTLPGFGPSAPAGRTAAPPPRSSASIRRGALNRLDSLLK